MGLTKNLGWLSKYITADSSGQIGIGCTPVEKFHVNSGTGNVPALFESTDPIAVAQFKDNNSTGLNAVGGQTNDLIFYSNNNINMRLNDSGNLGIGTEVSPSVSKFSVGVGNVTGRGQWASSAIAISNPTNIGAYSQISFGYTISTTNASAYMGYLSTNQGANGYGDLVFGTRAVNTDTQPSERMRITSGGNVGIGTSSPGAKIQVVGDTSGSMIKASYNTYDDIRTTYIDWFGIKTTAGNTNNNMEITMQGGNSSNGAILFSTGTSTATERMRITSGGLFGFNTQSPQRPYVFSNNGGPGFEISPESGVIKFLTYNRISGAYLPLSLCEGSTNVLIGTFVDNGFKLKVEGPCWFNGATYLPYVYGNTSGGSANVYISSSGELARSTSSLKYKKNIEDYGKGINEIMQMRPVTYNSINESEEGIKYAGLIAEEIHSLGLSEFVQYAEDGTPDALYYANMVSLLVKGIQELTERIKTLENK